MLLKRFYYIICLILGAIRSSPALAGWETVQIIDFGVIEVSGSTTITLGTNGNVSSASMISHRDEHQGIIRYNNDTGSSVKIQITRPGSASFTCVANCNNACSSLNASSFTFNPQGNKTVQNNSSQEWDL